MDDVGSTDFLYFSNNVCVFPFGKSGSTTVFTTHQKLSGYKVFYNLGNNFIIDHHESTKKKLIIHLREPLDRFWAAVRQDFKSSKIDNFEKYYKKNIDRILNSKEDIDYQDVDYKTRLNNHSKEDIVFRIRRVLELTTRWWNYVHIISIDNLDESLCKYWNVKEILHQNIHEDALKKKIHELRENNPDLDNKVLNFARIKKEQQLYSCVGKKFTIQEFTKKVIKISLSK